MKKKSGKPKKAAHVQLLLLGKFIYFVTQDQAKFTKKPLFKDRNTHFKLSCSQSEHNIRKKAPGNDNEKSDILEQEQNIQRDNNNNKTGKKRLNI